MSEWKIALVSVLLGVIVGFVLNELSQLVKKWRLTKQLKEALLDELNSKLYIKRDALKFLSFLTRKTLFHSGNSRENE
jgi:uncharacterized membrane-anchored protein YhcB (DUF1043 family)